MGGDNCRGGGRKSFWLSSAGKAGLSRNFQCNNKNNPNTAVECRLTEYNVDAPDYDKNDPTTDPLTNDHHYAHLLGTMCNAKNRQVCFDFDVTFTHYHNRLAKELGMWDGMNKDGKMSPKHEGNCQTGCLFNMTLDKCDVLGERWNVQDCPCIQNGDYWDFWEEIEGTIRAHPNTLWNGFEAILRRMGPSVQRGWGGNLFNKQWGMSSWLTVVITSAPTDTSQLGELKLNRGYKGDFNLNLDECNYYVPNIQKPPVDQIRCDPTYGTGSLLDLGSCIDDSLILASGFTTRPHELSLEKALLLLDKFEGWCLCKLGWTGPQAMPWERWVIAKTCDAPCTDNDPTRCFEEPPKYNLTDEVKGECLIEYQCDGDMTNPWPSCAEAYNFIGTVKICVPDDMILDGDWSTYFYVDMGIVVKQLWGDRVGWWQQANTKVKVKGETWDQDGLLPGSCTIIYFRAHKPNPNSLFVQDHVIKPNNKIDEHCGFFIIMDASGQIRLTNKKRQTQTACMSINTSGCYKPNLNNMGPPGTECGTIESQTTPIRCPVCPDNKIAARLLDNGVLLAERIALIEEIIGAPEGTLSVVLAEDSTMIININNNYEYYVKEMEQVGILFKEVNCQEIKSSIEGLNPEPSSSSSYVSKVGIGMISIILMIFY